MQISETLATFLHSNILSFAGNHQMQISETKGKKLIQIHGMLDIYVNEKMYTATASTTLEGGSTLG
jgi:predicted membrane GTPase involved in stress response